MKSSIVVATDGPHRIERSESNSMTFPHKLGKYLAQATRGVSDDIHCDDDISHNAFHRHIRQSNDIDDRETYGEFLTSSLIS